MALLEVRKLRVLLLMIMAINASVEWSFSAMKRVHIYLHKKQTQERLTRLLISFEKKILRCLENSPNLIAL
jgi:hypothetical protein